MDGVLKVELHGAMTFLTLPGLSKKIDESISAHTGDVHLDASKLSFMDSASHEYLDVLSKNIGDKMKMVKE